MSYKLQTAFDITAINGTKPDAQGKPQSLSIDTTWTAPSPVKGYHLIVGRKFAGQGLMTQSRIQQDLTTEAVTA